MDTHSNRSECIYQAEHDTQEKELISNGKTSILCVDDSKVIVEFLTELLEDFSYEVHGKTNAVEALATFNEDPTRFGLVITDLNMPVLTGEMLAAEITSVRPNIPIVLITGNGGIITERNFKEFGFSGFV